MARGEIVQFGRHLIGATLFPTFSHARGSSLTVRDPAELCLETRKPVLPSQVRGATRDPVRVSSHLCHLPPAPSVPRACHPLGTTEVGAVTIVAF